jgi:hypothetical protein
MPLSTPTRHLLSCYLVILYSVILLFCILLSCILLSCILLSCYPVSCYHVILLSCTLLSCYPVFCYPVSCYPVSCYLVSCYPVFCYHVILYPVILCICNISNLMCQHTFPASLFLSMFVINLLVLQFYGDGFQWNYIYLAPSRKAEYHEIIVRILFEIISLIRALFIVIWLFVFISSSLKSNSNWSQIILYSTETC